MNQAPVFLGVRSERLREGPVRASPSPAEIAFLLLAPVVAVIVFHISVINQAPGADGVDPEFYVGYGYSFVHMWRDFGPTYYAIRFPVIFLNEIFQRIGNGLVGYEVLRLLIFWGCGVPLFLMTRRLYGIGVACAAYGFLFLNPLLPFAMLWDLTTFVSIPAALSGIAVWHLRPKRTLIFSCASGFLFCVSVNSHAFTGTAILLFLMVEFSFALANPSHRRHVPRDIAGLAIGSVVCMALGLLFFWVQVGYVPPRVLWNVTLAAISSGHSYSVAYYVPFSRFFNTNYDVYVPYITTGLAVAVLRAALLRNTIEARITWFAILYCAAYAFAVFALRMNIVVYSFYLSHLVIVSYLTVPVVLGHARARSGALRAVLFGLGLLVPLAILRVWPAFVLHVAGVAHGSAMAVAIVAVVAIAAALLLGVGRTDAVGLAGLLLAAAVTQVPLLTGQYGPYVGMYVNSPSRAAELPLYEMIRQYRALLDQYDRPSARVRTWYGSDPDWLFRSLASGNLLFTVQDTAKFHFGMPEITQYERRSLADPKTKYVLLVARKEASVDEGVAALDKAGVKVERVKSEFWGEPPFTAHALLVRIVRRDLGSPRARP